MEGQEGGNDEGKDGGEDIGCHHKVGNFVIKGIGMAECACNDRVTCRDDHPACKRAVEEHVHEEFVVIEADAVRDPWAVMVHLQDAPVALGAMMASVWLCLVTPLANTDTAIAFSLYGGLKFNNRFA